jgi:hypothetical protein
VNSYSYSKDNPITLKDPNGLFVPEAVVGAGIGGLVGFGFQAASDLYAGRPSSFSTYAGAVTGGATFGAVVGATDGLSLLYTGLAGAASGVVQSGTTQSINVANGTQSGYSGNAFLNDVGINTVSSPSYSAGLEFELTGVAQSVELA